VLELGLHHEQQHQELILTDLKHLFAQNPLYPVYSEPRPFLPSQLQPRKWIEYRGGLCWLGSDREGFCFDNELPRHRIFLSPFRLASRLITNGEYLHFMQDRGYERPEFWLSDGWEEIQKQNGRAPLYWERRDGDWHEMTLSGLQPVRAEEPVCHVSFYEADAFAKWTGARLPSEAEWEVAAAELEIRGNFAENQLFHPKAAEAQKPGLLRGGNAKTCLFSEEIPNQEAPQQMYGDVWEWTSSSYSPYPGYRAPAGALGEYNGKFMCNQMVLRGGSCASPVSHIRSTYRNFFPPAARWQFSGIRLAQDA
jgi:ergothioneine biosynthesis protein EgtB